MVSIEEDANNGSGEGGGRIVGGIDGSEHADRAVQWATNQVRQTKAILEFHSSYGPGYVFVTPNEVQHSLQKIVDEAADRAHQTAPNIVTKGITHEGSAAESLIEARQDADLLVVGSRGMGGFRGLVLGSVSQQCAVRATCPVVIVH